MGMRLLISLCLYMCGRLRRLMVMQDLWCHGRWRILMRMLLYMRRLLLLLLLLPHLVVHIAQLVIHIAHTLIQRVIRQRAVVRPIQTRIIPLYIRHPQTPQRPLRLPNADFKPVRRFDRVNDLLPAYSAVPQVEEARDLCFKELKTGALIPVCERRAEARMRVIHVGDGGDLRFGIDPAPDFEGAVVGGAAFYLHFGTVGVCDGGLPVLLEGCVADVVFEGGEGGELLAFREGGDCSWRVGLDVAVAVGERWVG
jgi:hypothetical protein